MKIVFIGTSEFGIPTLEKLKGSEFDLAAVVTQPDKPVGRRQALSPSPVKKWAMENNIQVFSPENLAIGDWRLAIPEADVYVVASYGKIIPKEILEIPKYGALNIHPSLLPRYRGPSPIQSAILDGVKETGVTIIKMDEQMDHGPIISSKQTAVSSKLSYRDLHDRLAELGAQVLVDVLPRYIDGEIKPKEQEHDQATYTEIITRDHARINWENPAEVIDQQVRAYSSWPVAWTMLDDKRLKVYQAEPLAQETKNATSGEIIKADQELVVACGEGAIKILELQLEGKNKIPASDFLRGQKDLPGKILR